MQWLRLYDDVLDDPKCQQLNPKLFKAWVNLLCLANKSAQRGTLPPVSDIAFRLRITVAQAVEMTDQLVGFGLIDRDGETLRPHNWDGRQRKSDNVAERVAKHRSNVTGNVTETVDVTPPDTDTDTESDTESETEQKQSQKDSPPTPSPEGESPKPKRSRSKAMTTIPDDFEPSPEMVAKACETYGLTPEQVTAKTERFRRWAVSKRQTYADWGMGWLNFMEPKPWDSTAPPTPIRPPLPPGISQSKMDEYVSLRRARSYIPPDKEQAVDEYIAALEGRAAA